MDLILWRHAEAEASQPDDARVLTAKGHKQARKMGEWLNANLPSSCRIMSSPAKRAVQTADALGRKFKRLDALATDASVTGILQAVDWPDGHGPVLIIGHQPTLGQVAAYLIGGSQQDWTIRKANVWWIGQRPSGDGEGLRASGACYLRAVLGPDLLRN